MGMENGQLNWITGFIWNIADDVLRDVYVQQGRGRQGVPERDEEQRQGSGQTGARQGSREDHCRLRLGPHGAIQAVLREPQLQEVAGRHHLLGDL
jgi:hypothetical protein